MSDSTQQATFAGGCFWCVEAVFKRLKGVLSIQSGYAGGTVEAPSYEQVCTGDTGHAEVIHLTFDPEVIDYATLLSVFFTSHDPTTLNRQGEDVGTQYRSSIFYHDEQQKQLAASFIQQHQTDFDAPIVTQLEPFAHYYAAEGYHQDFYQRNPQQAYCNAVIPAKLAKLRKTWLHLLQDAK